jgi:hypothetical protein
VLLVSSEQDDVVPSNSARIEDLKNSTFSDDKRTDYSTMVQNIMTSMEVTGTNLIRYVVSFGTSVTGDSKMDKWLGKAAHARFLDDRLFLQMFTSCIYKYFVCEDLSKSVRRRKVIRYVIEPLPYLISPSLA